MAQITITNVSSDAFYLNDIYATIPAGESVETQRAISEISAMAGLQAAVTAGVLTLSIEYSASELASGLALAAGPSIPAAVEAADLVAAPISIRKAMVSGGASGTADDVTIYAVNNLPYAIRILDAHAVISTAVIGSSLTVRSAAAGAGTQAAVVSSASAGVARASALGASNTSVLLTPGSSVGLFVRRSDRSVVGEVVITARREY
jgi:hypothetical protein